MLQNLWSVSPEYAITPAFVDSKEGSVHFQGAAARMVRAVYLQALPIEDAAGDVEDHGIVEKVGAGEAKAMVAVGLGEMGIMLVIMGVFHLRQASVIRIY
jgi:hypothetical protein